MVNSYPLNTFIAELQAAFASRGMTLPTGTADAWIRSEQTVNNGNITWNSGSAAVYNNPLGLGWNGSTWNQYTSFNQAAQAYANTISQYYPTVEKTLSNPNVTAWTAASVIASSPWAGTSGYGSSSPIRQLANSNGAPPHGAVSNGAPTNQGAISGAANPPAPNSTQSQGPGTGIFDSIQTAIGFVGVIIIGLVFVLGAFLLAKNDKSQVVVV